MSTRILVLCTGNSRRSPIGEGVWVTIPLGVLDPGLPGSHRHGCRVGGAETLGVSKLEIGLQRAFAVGKYAERESEDVSQTQVI